jgi:signal transduction histidine kinase
MNADVASFGAPHLGARVKCAFSRPTLRRYAVAAAALGAAFVIRYLLAPVLGDELPFLLFVAATLIAAWYGGLGPGLTSLVAGILFGIYFLSGHTVAGNSPSNVDELRIARYLVTTCLGIAVIEALHRSRRTVQAAAEQVRRHADALEAEVTERKQSEAALRDAKAELSQYTAGLEARVNERTAELQESLKALDDVLYHVAHDLRAPLRSMEGFTSIMLKEHGNQLDAAGREYARRVSEAAGRMDQLLHGLLEYGRMAQMEVRRRPVDVRAVAHSVLARLAGQVKAARAEITVEAPLPEWQADGDVVEILLLHLIKNAVTFVAPWDSPRVRIWAENSGGHVKLWIEDQGIGIEPEYQRRIFWVFERLNPAYPGLGIGLAIVAKGVQRMCGRMGLESAPGKGSKFWLELPGKMS